VNVPIAGIQGVTIVPNVSIERLYTADSIKIEAQQQFEHAVDVGIEYALWDQDATFVQQWLGGSGSSASSMTDTTDPQKFTLDGVFDSVNGDRTLTTQVTGITFEEMPVIDTEMGEYVSRDLSGTGEDMADVSTTDNTV
jgi:hypothetical protein